MSEMIKCDSCGRLDYTDSRSETEYWKMTSDGRDGYSTFHLCAPCYKRLLKQILNWTDEDFENDGFLTDV